MKLNPSFYTLCLMVNQVFGATSCIKNACYNAVASQGQQSPASLASRKADCSALLTIYLDIGITRTTTRTMTDPTSIDTLTKVATRTATVTVPPNTRQKRSLSLGELLPAFLHRRDSSSINATKPAYASNCVSNEDYTSACVCNGVRITTIRRTATETQTVHITKRPVSTKTTSVTTTLTKTSTLTAFPTTCNVDQARECAMHSCRCFVSVENNQRVCSESLDCKPCETDLDCTTRFNLPEGVCVVDKAVCPDKGKTCAYYGYCPAPKPLYD